MDLRTHECPKHGEEACECYAAKSMRSRRRAMYAVHGKRHIHWCAQDPRVSFICRLRPVGGFSQAPPLTKFEADVINTAPEVRPLA